MIKTVKLSEKLAQINDHWNPRLVGQVNDIAIKLVKFQGEFDWHHHEHEDELFYVVKGSFTMRLQEGNVKVYEGEFIIIPRGTEHAPYAENEVEVMLIEPKTTLNTGNIENEKTVRELETL